MANFIYGFHAVLARLKQHPKSIQLVLLDEKRADSRAKSVLEYAKINQIEVRFDNFKNNKKIESLRHQGVLAYVNAQKKAVQFADLLETLTPPSLLLVLDNITDPRNLGALLRVADGAGAKAVIAPKDRSVGLNEIAIKTASGAAESVPYVMVTNLARTLRTLKESGFLVVGLADAAEQNFYQIELSQNLALVVGSEGEGLRQLTMKTCDVLAFLPMFGMVESLNVSVAAGIALFEAQRRYLNN